MPSKRLPVNEKPWVVKSLVGSRRNYRHHDEDFDDEGKARKRAEKIAQEKNVLSVYLTHQDKDGYPISTEPIKRPSETVESAVTGSDSSE